MIRLLLLVAALAVAGGYLVRRLEKRRRERLALVRSNFLVTKAEGANHESGREASLRSGALRLRVPTTWAEEYPDPCHAVFRDPAVSGRVLRVESQMVAGNDLQALLRGRAGGEASTVEPLPGGCVLLKCLDSGRERGQDSLIFRWLTAAPAAAGHSRIASFALSLPDSAAFDPLSRELVAFVEREVRAGVGAAE